MTCPSDQRRLHLWGLIRGMEIGGKELVEESMFGTDPDRARRNLGKMVSAIARAALPDRVYRTAQFCPGIRAIERTA